MSTSPGPPSDRAAFARLFDDAAMFPPGNASAPEAIREHLRLRASSYADLVGPLLVPAAGWGGFTAACEEAGGPELRVVVVGTTTMPDAVPEGVTVVGFEVPVRDLPLPAVDGDRSLAAEISRGPGGDRVLAAVAREAAAGRPVVAKFRTGGTSADAFPSERVLAEVIVSAVSAGAPLKLTAGLHHAVRFTGPGTGFEHHGFLNVLVAFARATAGEDADVDRLADVLAERDGEALAEAFLLLADDARRAARRAFVSFGCCGVQDPIDDLVSLYLIEE